MGYENTATRLLSLYFLRRFSFFDWGENPPQWATQERIIKGILSLQKEVIIEFKQTSKQATKQTPNFIPLLTAKLAKSHKMSHFMG